MTVIDKNRLLQSIRVQTVDEPFRAYLGANVPEQLDGDALEAMVKSYLALGNDLSVPHQQTVEQIRRVLDSRPLYDLVGEKLESLRELTPVSARKGAKKAKELGPPAFSSVAAPRVPSGRPSPEITRAWRATTGQYMYSCPVVSPDGTKLFALGNGGTLTAHDLTNGNTLWSYATGAYNTYSSPAASPDGTSVAIVTGGSNNNYYESQVTLVDAETGNVTWQKKLSNNGNSPQSSPTFTKDGKTLLVCCADDNVRAYDVETGEERWPAHYLSGCAWTYTAPVVTDDGNTAFIPTNSTGFYALDLETGKQRWTATRDGMSHATPSLSPDEKTVYVLGYQTAYAYDSETGELKWQRNLGAYFANGPSRALVTLDGDKLIVPSNDGRIFILNTEDGEISRQVSVSNSTSYIGQPSLSRDGQLAYFVDSYGKFTVLDIEEETTRQLPASAGNNCYGGFAVSSDGEWAFVGHSGTDTIDAVKLTE